jgi:hypothetical protein
MEKLPSVVPQTLRNDDYYPYKLRTRRNLLHAANCNKWEVAP